MLESWRGVVDNPFSRSGMPFKRTAAQQLHSKAPSPAFPTVAGCTPPRPVAIADGARFWNLERGSPPHQVDTSSTGGRAWLSGARKDARSTVFRRA